MGDSGDYMTFVWAAYAVAFVILGGITASSIVKYLHLKKQPGE